MKFKRNDQTPRRKVRRVLRYEVEWTTRYMLEGSRDQRWRECRILDVSREGAGVDLFDATPEETRTHRVVVEMEIPPAVLRLHGDVRHISPGKDGGVHVGLQFSGLSVLERDMLDSLLERESTALPILRRTP